MAKKVMMDQFHLTVYAPSRLAEAEYAAIRRALDRSSFRAELTQALRPVFQRHSPLRSVRIALTR
jgi:hypothetical protein